jgi:GNAT superfamily N-acetyltransferase
MRQDGEAEARPLGPDAVAEAWEAMAVCEPHEAAWWARAYRHAAGRPSDPLGARAMSVGDITCTASSVLDFASLNRVLGLSTPGALSADVLDEALDFFASAGVRNFRVEVPQPLLNGELMDRLGSRQLALVPHAAMAKLMRGTDYAEHMSEGPPPRLLGPDDMDAFADLNRRAWGLPRAFKTLYAATFGTPGLFTLGIEEQEKLVATTSFYVEAGLAWTGYAAVLPGEQGKGHTVALGPRACAIARVNGCTAQHAETRSEVDQVSNLALRMMLRRGWTYLYDRLYFQPPA